MQPEKIKTNPRNKIEKSARASFDFVSGIGFDFFRLHARGAARVVGRKETSGAGPLSASRGKAHARDVADEDQRDGMELSWTGESSGGRYVGRGESLSAGAAAGSGTFRGALQSRLPVARTKQGGPGEE